MKFSHQNYTQLCQKIWHHNYLYYILHAPELSDEEYDSLYKQLEEMEAAHPEWVTSTSPSQRVNESLTQGFNTVAHDVPMLSLANTYNPEELTQFVKLSLIHI